MLFTPYTSIVNVSMPLLLSSLKAFRSPYAMLQLLFTPSLPLIRSSHLSIDAPSLNPLDAIGICLSKQKLM